jgi:hypothetical protein
MTTFSAAIIVAISASALAGFGLYSSFSGNYRKNRDRRRGIDRRHWQPGDFIETYDDSRCWITNDRRRQADRRLTSNLVRES